MNVFLTGASSGIGRATAEILVAAGHSVWGTSRDMTRVPALPNLHPVRLDLRDRASIDEAFQHATREAGQLDVVINNAGSGHFGPVESLTTDLLRDQFETLVIAQVQLCQLAIAAMRPQDRGLLINVSSLAARLPVPYMASYNAAKAAMASFTMTMQLELATTRIRIIDLQPADIATSFNDAIEKPQETLSSTDARVDRTWTIVDRNMREAPKPELIGRQILDLIASDDPPPRVTVGGAFQAKVAPFVDTFLPQRVRLWGLRNYYGI